MGKVKPKSLQTKMVMGVICAVVICLLGLAAMVYLIQSEKVGERGMTAAVPVLLALSSLIGNRICTSSLDNSHMITAAICTGTLLIMMLIGGFILDGPFNGIAANMGSVVAGGLLSCVICLKKPAKSVRRKRRYR